MAVMIYKFGRSKSLSVRYLYFKVPGPAECRYPLVSRNICLSKVASQALELMLEPSPDFSQKLI